MEERAKEQGQVAYEAWVYEFSSGNLTIPWDKLSAPIRYKWKMIENTALFHAPEAVRLRAESEEWHRLKVLGKQVVVNTLYTEKLKEEIDKRLKDNGIV